jgi:hypothetical protein
MAPALLQRHLSVHHGLRSFPILADVSAYIATSLWPASQHGGDAHHGVMAARRAQLLQWAQT